MAFETESCLRCDRCQASSERFDRAIFTKSMMLSDLRELGWVRRSGGRTTNAGDECPDCSGASAKVKAL